MTYYLIKWNVGRCGDCGQIAGGCYQVLRSVETIDEVKEWVVRHYNENHPPYAIKGEKVEFDFSTTITAKVKDGGS
ncbi:MAG: hypothetical protein KAI71_05220 [Candidatus Pacebacteria bacterium]|nr:hypothetical protein [Candidatus Paceibacterota bacterium]